MDSLTGFHSQTGAIPFVFGFVKNGEYARETDVRPPIEHGPCVCPHLVITCRERAHIVAGTRIDGIVRPPVDSLLIVEPRVKLITKGYPPVSVTSLHRQTLGAHHLSGLVEQFHIEHLVKHVSGLKVAAEVT